MTHLPQDENKPSIALTFTKDDFFNEYEMKQFIGHISELTDYEAYMKKAIIHRVMIENQSDDNILYEKLMGYIQSKGIERVIDLIEKRDNSVAIDEKAVEQIVYRILKERQISSIGSISVIQEEEQVDMQKAKTQKKPVEERKKASSKLKKL